MIVIMTQEFDFDFFYLWLLIYNFIGIIILTKKKVFNMYLNKK